MTIIIVATIICGALRFSIVNLEVAFAKSHRWNFNAKLEFILAYLQVIFKSLLYGFISNFFSVISRGCLMEIIEGIHRIDEASSNIAHSNVYLVINGKELIVIDTGTSGNAKKIVAYIQKIGHQPSEVSTIILTHYHMDHAGSAKELKDLTNAKSSCSIRKMQILLPEKNPIRNQKTFFLGQFRLLSRPEPVDVEIALKDGDKIGNLKVIAISGAFTWKHCFA